MTKTKLVVTKPQMTNVQRRLLAIYNDGYGSPGPNPYPQGTPEWEAYEDGCVERRMSDRHRAGEL